MAENAHALPLRFSIANQYQLFAYVIFESNEQGPRHDKRLAIMNRFRIPLLQLTGKSSRPVHTSAWNVGGLARYEWPALSHVRPLGRRLRDAFARLYFRHGRGLLRPSPLGATADY